MARKIEVTIEIIVHATEDINTILECFFEIFDIKDREFSRKALTGHFDNPITLLKLKIKKNDAENFVKTLISKIPKGELAGIIDELENRIQESALHIRLGKQDLIQGSLVLQEKDAIKVKIYTPVYLKKNILRSYTQILKSKE